MCEISRAAPASASGGASDIRKMRIRYGLGVCLRIGARGIGQSRRSYGTRLVLASLRDGGYLRVAVADVEPEPLELVGLS